MDNFNITLYSTAFLSLLFSELVGRFLYKSDMPFLLIDIPDTRKIHTTPTPLLGGITVVFSLYFIFVGLFDDLFKWDYQKKLFLQPKVKECATIACEKYRNRKHLVSINSYVTQLLLLHWCQ